MRIEDVPFNITDFSEVPSVEHAGKSGVARWRTVARGNVRVRIVEYSPGYEADHWCDKGHVVLVLEGELTTRLADGRSFVLVPGQSYQVADGAAPHMSVSARGARLFIVD